MYDDNPIWEAEEPDYYNRNQNMDPCQPHNSFLKGAKDPWSSVFTNECEPIFLSIETVPEMFISFDNSFHMRAYCHCL